MTTKTTTTTQPVCGFQARCICCGSTELTIALDDLDSVTCNHCLGCWSASELRERVNSWLPLLAFLALAEATPEAQWLERGEATQARKSRCHHDNAE